MPIDVHSHCVPPEVLTELTVRGRGYGVEVRGEPLRAHPPGAPPSRPLHPDLFDIEDRITAMDTAGVRMQLLSCFIDLTAYGLEPAAGRRYCAMVNDALAHTAQRRPDRFGALGTVPLQDPLGAAAELTRAVSELGMAGVQIATTVNGAELDDPALAPFWERAEELRCLVLLHPYNALAGRGLQRYFTANSVANPAETTIALAHLIEGGVLVRHPGLQMCAVHGGGFLPYQVGRLQRARTHGPSPGTGATGPREALSRLYYDTVVHDTAALEHLVRLVGAQRLLLGSDHPFEMGDPDPVRTVHAVPGLDDDARHAVLSGNATRILQGVRR
jgi:aminocarboxymuconate-semialdehyde decarboxylase